MSETQSTGSIDPIQHAWDDAYAEGKYVFDPPVPFAKEISSFVGEHLPADARGLYVGCGNGRNFIPIAKSGLHLDGIDMSREGIEQLQQALPNHDGKLEVGDFHTLSGAWDYLISLQVFQHGDQASSYDHFAQSARLLKPGGYLFLRVNAASTQLDLAHELVEGSEGASRTVRYTEGHKAEAHIPIHYFEREELEALAGQNGFVISRPLSEHRTDRKLPRHGFWSQWETIWQKTT